MIKGDEMVIIYSDKIVLQDNIQEGYIFFCIFCTAIQLLFPFRYMIKWSTAPNKGSPAKIEP